MKPFFSADDFSFNSEAFNSLAAECANAKIKREGVVVYGQLSFGEFYWNHGREYTDTHRAILINIEKIEKKCDHIFNLNYGICNTPQNAECKKCGVKLKATWEEVK